jgi:4-hydroxyphenylpyruvate dioxygenase/4-hydroxymandelate synthase
MIDTKSISYIAFDAPDITQIVTNLLAPCGFAPVCEINRNGNRQEVVLAQNAIAILVCRADRPSLSADVSVRDIAFTVADVPTAFDEVVRRGATVIQEPATCLIGARRVTRATVGGIGNLVHSLVDADLAAQTTVAGRLREVDHVAMCLRQGTLEATVDYYRRTFGFHVSHEEYVETESSGMRSQVVESANHRIRFPLQEPSTGHSHGQIEEYLANHGGPGVQHVAFLTDDILGSIQRMKDGGIEFVAAPSGYYDELKPLGPISEELADVRASNVLVDWESSGYLMQIFTKSREPRKTLFFEVIQRRNARGFGSANIRALFRALERQA